MVMKQSLYAGTVDNISCIFICFNNFKQIMQNKFQPSNNTNKETKIPYDIKDQYSNPKDITNSINFEEIRKRIYFTKENTINLKKNENIKLNQYENSNQSIFAEKKPKTSSDAIKSNRLDLIAGFPEGNTNENNDYANNNINTDSNGTGEMDKFLYKIVSKKIKTPGIASFKNYESTLPTFKISQRLNKLPKELNNIKNVSPSNRIFTNNQSNNANYASSNMNFTTKNSRFLPNINNKQLHLNGNNSNHLGEIKNNNGYKLSKGLQFNFNFNK